MRFKEGFEMILEVKWRLMEGFYEWNKVENGVIGEWKGRVEWWKMEFLSSLSLGKQQVL